MVYYPFTVLAHTKTTIHPGVGGWWMIFTLPLSTPATSTSVDSCSLYNTDH